MKRTAVLGILGIIAVLIPQIMMAQSSTPQHVTREELTRMFYEKNWKVNELWQQKKYSEAIRILEELNALPDLAEVEDAQLDVYYNLACGYSLLRQTEKALSCFEAAVGLGYSDLFHVGQDPDLDNIRNEPRFRAACDKLRRAAEFWNNPLFATPYRADISREEKIAGLSLFWSEVKYNFVFLDRLKQLNWDSLYFAYLPLVERTGTTGEYYRLLCRLCALLQDGHTNVNIPSELWNEQYAAPSIGLWIVNDTVFVLSADDSLRSSGIIRGCQIVSVEGKPVIEYAKQNVYPYLSASTPQALQLDAYWRGNLLAGPQGTRLKVEFRDSTGARFTRMLYRPISQSKTMSSNARGTASSAKPLASLRILRGNIGCVSLDSFNDPRVVTEFDSLFPTVLQTDGLVLDVRANGGGSSDNGWKILSYLTDKPFATSQWRTREYRPTYRAWGRGDQWFSQKGEDFKPNGKTVYTKPVVVLAGPRTFSAAEDFCVAFDCMHRGTIIGLPTGGSTGQPLMFKLPGGGSARVCTKHDRYPDGREFVGVGVIPAIEVSQTVEDVLNARDKTLDAAIDFLLTRMK